MKWNSFRDTQPKPYQQILVEIVFDDVTNKKYLAMAIYNSTDDKGNLLPVEEHVLAEHRIQGQEYPYRCIDIGYEWKEFRYWDWLDPEDYQF